MLNDTPQLSGVAAARADILRRIAAAAENAGRDPASITLVGVSKQQRWERVAEALDAGQRVFGENRVQEAQERWRATRAAGPAIELRLIGPLQTNKTRDAVQLFDVIETLDRDRLARSLADAAQGLGRCPDVLIQVNTGEEPQKAGISPHESDAFIDRVRREFQLPLKGLMCIPPADEPPGLHFGLLAEIARRNGLLNLSMGMSNDFETAIRFGATHVRVGSALFGDRAIHPK
jgi:pyridoxal phosphate enzyme (YggS family)